MQFNITSVAVITALSLGHLRATEATASTAALAAKDVKKATVDPTVGLDRYKVEEYFKNNLSRSTPTETLAAITAGCAYLSKEDIERTPQLVDSINAACFDALVAANEALAAQVVRPVATQEQAKLVTARLQRGLEKLGAEKIGKESSLVKMELEKVKQPAAANAEATGTASSTAGNGASGVQVSSAVFAVLAALFIAA